MKYKALLSTQNTVHLLHNLHPITLFSTISCAERFNLPVAGKTFGTYSKKLLTSRAKFLESIKKIVDVKRKIS